MTTENEDASLSVIEFCRHFNGRMAEWQAQLGARVDDIAIAAAYSAVDLASCHVGDTPAAIAWGAPRAGRDGGGPAPHRGDATMTALANLIAAPADVRTAALALLDDLSAPLQPRDLERALQNGGLTRTQARRAMHALRAVHVVALVAK